jgi:ATP-binding cassette subfamily B protein
MLSSFQLLRPIKRELRVGRALGLVWQSGPGWAIASIALLVVQGLMPLLTLYLMKLTIDAVVLGAAELDKAAAFRHVLLFVGLAGMLGVASAIFDTLATIVNETQAQLVTDYMQGKLHAKAIEVDLEYYENTRYHDTLHRAQQEAPFRPTRIVRDLIQVGQGGISLLGIGALLLSFHWGIGVVLLAAALPGALVRLRSSSELYHWRRKRTWIQRQVEYYNYLLTLEHHAKEVRLFGLGPLFIRRSRDLRRQMRQETLAMTTRRSSRELAAQVIALLPVFGAYAFVAYQVVHGDVSVGGLVMYYQAFQRGQGALQSTLNGFAGLYEDSLFIANLYEFLDLKRKVVEPSDPSPVPIPMQTGIVFDHVHFQYPMSTRKALHDINLTIRPGEVIALVGENGSGKTTLVKLLSRLYDPTGGRITVDNIDLRQFNTSAWRREISVILQDYVRYHMTARENIWLGNPDLAPDHEQIIAAARLSGAHDLIVSLKNGYDSVLSKWLVDGEELSIGEWQKLALARAFVRDAQLIILDEPTSALDPRAEAEVFEGLRGLVADRMAILISHRLSTVKMADRIYVMKHGRIVESGTHDELIRWGCLYASLFEIQARSYR